MTERSLHPVEYLLILKRRKAWFVIPFLVCAVVGIALAMLLPATYRSRATIAVQAPAVSPDLVAARASLNNDERIRALYQQLRSPAVLERVAREEGLAREQPIEQAAQDLNERLEVELQKPVAGQPDLNAFHIVYDDSTPERAQRIANRVAQVFVDEHSRTREMQAEGTAEFLGTQLRTSQEKINALEARLRQAKEQHSGRLPEQTMVNMQSVSGARQQLENTTNAIRIEQDRLSLVDRQMQSMRQGAYAAPLGSPSQMRSPQQRVLELERELALARSKYTDKHPEIQLLEEDLKNARAEAAALGQRPQSTRDQLLAADPLYQQLEQEKNQIGIRIKAYQRVEAQLQGDISRYQRAIDSAPMVEQALSGLQREYDLERENYKSLSERHSAAQVQEQIARTRGGERFSVLNGAYLPQTPERPNRLRIALVALALGFALGGALVFVREYLDWSIRGDAQVLQDQFDVPVLAEIPRIRPAA